ncbi:MAG: sigma-70 family RNA polymerase sigma factor [Nitrospirae bacterium]|nr:sigma-70 family RNA polymerase sigma factor [Nitrospirota bacterium]MBI3351681.1 sigma-70 family RNA polymerase sigma factor [Nitrospirota bacterium]
MEKFELSSPDKWVDSYGDYLYRCALARVRDPKLAEEIVQETFLAGLQSRDQFRGESSERGWLVGILKHKVIEYFRKTSREFTVETPEPFGDEFEGVFDEIGHWKGDKTGPCEWNQNPDTLLERKEFWIALDGCLSRLPSRMANVFSLREIDDIGSEKICEVLDISTSNLWVLLHRARMQLRQCLEIQFFGTKSPEGKV